ncbi:MAG TPA: flagellin [Firmicutes bacterium]|nr:flagellin [Bacillota bacterium]
MRINHNINALNAWRNLTITDGSLAKSLEKLSSGYRINRAADDAAGLAISEKMRAQVQGLQLAQRNAQNAVSLIQTAEGALNETHAILLRMRELAVQASSTTLQAEDRNAITAEMTELKKELARISDTTEFNGIKLLNGDLAVKLANVGTGIGVAQGISKIDVSGALTRVYRLDYVAVDKKLTLTRRNATNTADEASESIVLASLPTGYDTVEVNFSSLGIKVTLNANLTADISLNNTFEVQASGTGVATVLIGANAGQELTFNIGNMSDVGLGVNTVAVDTVTNAGAAITAIDAAIQTVSNQRATLGAIQNRLEHTILNLGVAAENLTAAESRIRDVDMALEMAEFTKNQILVQSGTAMLAQANVQPQAILKLLQG